MLSIVAAVAVHSKGNMILFPWGYAADPPPHPNAEEMSRLAYKMYWKIKTKTEDKAIYVSGTACQAFGHAKWCPAGGATDDWYGSLGIKYAYTFELIEDDKDGVCDKNDIQEFELQMMVHEDFTITISWLKVPTSAFTFKTLLRHYAKRALPHGK